MSRLSMCDLSKALGRFQGTQHRHIFAIHREQVVKLLQYALEEHCVCVLGSTASVGPAGSLSTSGEMRFVGTATLSGAYCRMKGTTGS